LSTDLELYSQIIELQKEIELHVKVVSSEPQVYAYYRAGAVVQSGLLAALLFLSVEKTAAQTDSINQQIKRDLVQLVYHPDKKDWNRVERQLLDQKYPIAPYLAAMYHDVDSMSLSAGIPDSLHPENELYDMQEKIGKLQKQRMRQDYRRLKEVLKESNPKLSISSNLVFSVDQNGKVVGVRINSRDRKKRISPELRDTIIKLLEQRQFYAYEARGYLFKKKNKKMRREIRQRRGPLD